jgi:hypothetical protein
MKYTLAMVLLAVVGSAGCADQMITLRYSAPAVAPIVGPRLTILPLVDQRGEEGDHGDPYRVGGIYGQYGNRMAKIKTNEPWPQELLRALVAEFRGQGIDASAGTDSSGSGSGYVLAGEIRNFSTEQRFTYRAHVSGIVTVQDANGRMLAAKRIEATAVAEGQGEFQAEKLLNDALAKFVRSVASDLDIRTVLR